jgi:hypothetical protein
VPAVLLLLKFTTPKSKLTLLILALPALAELLKLIAPPKASVKAGTLAELLTMPPPAPMPWMFSVRPVRAKL